MALEKPKYKLIQKEGHFEIREYQPYLASRVMVTAANYKNAASQGFSPLANYIFGGNTSKNKIAMTAPVAAQPVSEKIAMTAPVMVTGEDQYIVEFVIPGKYTLETLPDPLDDNVTFHQYPGRRIAAVRFSGRFQQDNFQKHIEMLRGWLRKQGLQEKGKPIIAGYDPPFTPWFLKHNEVLIEIDKEK